MKKALNLKKVRHAATILLVALVPTIMIASIIYFAVTHGTGLLIAGY
jgi:hypothetical protein